MINNETEVIPRQTLAAMTGAYEQSKQEITQACAMLKQARERLEQVFGTEHYTFSYPHNLHNPEEADTILAEFKRDAWRIMVARMELRRLMSVKRSKQLDDQLEERQSYHGPDGRNVVEKLPELTYENVIAMLEGTAGQVKDFLSEAIHEVFDFLRPPHSQYKTNSEFEVGRRVIKGWWIRPGYGQCYSVNYDAQAKVTALDNVFHLLDGKGPVKTTRGPLVDAIEKTTHAEGKGETEYFRFKCFGNGNLHLEFKRMDLVAKLNKVAGGNRLKPNNT